MQEMKKILGIFAALIAALVLTSCKTTRVNTLTSEQDAFADARKTWKAGQTTYDEMKEKYGEPSDKAQIENGFAARWLERRTVTRSVPVYGNANPVATFEAELNRPSHVQTITTALEAFYTTDGILTNFRLQILDDK